MRNEGCTEELGYGDCTKATNKFCKILTNDPLKRPFKCQCSAEEGGTNVDQCFEYQIDPHRYCLPGYVINEQPDKEFPQDCVKGASTFNITFKLRFDLNAGNSSDVLLGNYFDLKDSISLKKMPARLTEQFVDYRQQSLFYSMNKVMNKEITKRNLEEILRNAITRSNMDAFCRLINVVPHVSFDESKLDLFRILETLVDANISITCANQLTVFEFLTTFKHYMRYNKLNAGTYHYLSRVGYVLPESIKTV